MTIASFVDVVSKLDPDYSWNRQSIANGMNAPLNMQTLWTTVTGMTSLGPWLAGVIPGILNGAVPASGVAGSMPWNDPPSGKTGYVAFFEAMATSIGMDATAGMLLCDRVWASGAINMTITTPQTIVTPTWPARDDDGTSNGKGVLLGFDHVASGAAGATSVSVSYTNSAGVSGRTGTAILAVGLANAVSRFELLSLQAGDLGVKSVESVTLNAVGTTGTFGLVAFRILVSFVLSSKFNVPQQMDPFNGLMPKVPLSPCLFLTGIQANANVASALSPSGRIKMAYD